MNNDKIILVSNTRSIYNNNNRGEIMGRNAKKFIENRRKSEQEAKINKVKNQRGRNFKMMMKKKERAGLFLKGEEFLHLVHHLSG